VITDSASSTAHVPTTQGESAQRATSRLVPSGIRPLDERLGGLEKGGTYLVVGAPGPEKMVAALQFISEGVRRGEKCLLVTNAELEGILDVAAAWGFDLRDAWKQGTLQIVGFRDDFELRAIRSIAPEEVLEELNAIVGPGLSRIAVDPGSMFLTGGAKTLLGSSFLAWSRRQDATVLATFSVDGGATYLPSSADWLIHATTGRLLLERRNDGLYQVTLSRAVPEPGEHGHAVTLDLAAGAGLVEPKRFPARRGVDRAGIDEGKLLMVSLGGTPASDLRAWATRAFDTDVVSEPFEAVAKVQADAKYGAILIHAPRQKVRDAVQACRAIRPLTRAAIVFASDDAVRSTDRIHILESGADDCLSGGLDFRELELRIKQSIATSAPHVVEGAAGDELAVPPVGEAPRGGSVPSADFVGEVRRRAALPDLSFFCVLDVAWDAIPSGELQAALADLVRAEEGDLVSTAGRGCVVLLQGARESQLRPFVDRVRSRLAERAASPGSSPDIAVLSHPADAERISALLGSNGADAG
jgi:CheY-like chemotaxis protein